MIIQHQSNIYNRNLINNKYLILFCSSKQYYMINYKKILYKYYFIVKDKIINFNQIKQNKLTIQSYILHIKYSQIMSFTGQHDNLRVTQLVEDFHPIIRRRAMTSIRNSFPSFFSTQNISTPIPVDQSQKIIYEQYNKIHNIIDLVDEHIRKRIECYENQVVNVVQKEIQQMRQQTDKVVQQFNLMIQEKNKQTQILSLNNELDYFKNEAKKLFQDNKRLKRQNQQFKKQKKQFIYELQNKEVIMQKLLMKYQKQKYYKQKIKQKMNLKAELIKLQAQEQHSVKQNILNKIFNKKKQTSKQKSIMEEIKFDSGLSDSFNNNNNHNKNDNHNDNDNNNDNNNNQISLLNNSVLKIECGSDEEQSNSHMSINASSVILTQHQPQMKNQQSQANIYLSEYDYKYLFQKKIKSNKTILKEIAVQTEIQFSERYINNNKSNQIYIKGSLNNHNIEKGQRSTNYFSPINQKSLNFTKTGFNKTKNSYSYFPSSKKNISRRDIRIERLATEPQSQTQIDFDFSKHDLKMCRNTNISQLNSKNQKMAIKFQTNKIMRKALSRQKMNQSLNR